VARASARLHLRVVPGAATTRLVGRYGDAWKVRVAAPADRGKANDAVLELLAYALSVPRGALRLVSGHGARDKIVEAAGVDPAAAEQRLAAAGRKDASQT
jgi:uncharacterized protein YggU (UPF0235/DUF167 family)